MSASIIGENLITPYVLRKIVNETDEVVYENIPVIKRRVISQETSTKMRYSLESVAALGTGRNAYVDGYRVVWKTGKAQKGWREWTVYSRWLYLKFFSCYTYEWNKGSCLLTVDNPKTSIKYGVLVVWIIGDIFE